jgi:hypothetical protein
MDDLLGGLKGGDDSGTGSGYGAPDAPASSYTAPSSSYGAPAAAAPR